jgi:hypothetical protein
MRLILADNEIKKDQLQNKFCLAHKKTRAKPGFVIPLMIKLFYLFGCGV